jgi:hypothetical protein
MREDPKMLCKKSRVLLTAALVSALTCSQALSFTAQNAIDGYEFQTILRVWTLALGDSTTEILDVPDDRVAVVTDIHLVLEGTTIATEDQYVYLVNDTYTGGITGIVAGPFIVKPGEAVSEHYTSGLTFTDERQIRIENVGDRAVIVNLIGYLVCPGSCD